MGAEGRHGLLLARWGSLGPFVAVSSTLTAQAAARVPIQLPHLRTRMTVLAERR
jgi:hypothetical protein